MPHTGMTVIPETVFDCSFLDGGVESTLFELPDQGQIAYNGMLPRGPFDRDLSFLDRVPEAEKHAVCAYLNNQDVSQQPCDERPAIQALREAHMALEAAVLAEYGWGDLAEKPWVFDRPWIDGSWRFVPNAETRREYLRRLEWLNHEQAARAPISTPAVI